jgi:hypothetical protein
MTTLYSWSATKCNRTIGTYWVDHSLKGRRMECIIETGLYRPRVKFLVMLEVVQTIYTQNMPQNWWANFLGKLKKGGWYLWTEWFSVTGKQLKRFADRCSVLLPSFSLLSFPLSLGPVLNDTHHWRLHSNLKIKNINQCSCSLLICFMYLRIILSCVHLAC